VKASIELLASKAFGALIAFSIRQLDYGDFMDII